MKKRRLIFFLSILATVIAITVTTLTSSCTPHKYGPPKENIYRIPIGGKFVSLDPYLTTDVYSSQAEALTYESLYEYHFLKKPLTLIPSLAAALPEVKNNGKTYVFKLKQGILFQNDPCFKATNGKGREVTAQDFVYFFERNADKKLGSPLYGDLEELIVGIRDYRDGKTPTISGVKVINRYTVQVDLTKPNPRFVYGFSGNHGAIIAKECVEFYGERFSEHAVGTGPFIITSYSRTKVTAVRNPNYRKEFYPSDGSTEARTQGLLADANKQIPFIDKVEIEVLEEDQPRWLKFMSGEFEQAGVPKDNMPTALPQGHLNTELSQRGVKHYQAVLADVVVQVFNFNDPVWGKNKILREAFVLAIDLPQYIAVAYGGYAQIAHSLLDPYSYGYDPKYVSPYSQRNVAKAKTLLAKAGYPNGTGLPPLILPNSASSTSRQIMELLQRQMNDVGIKIQYEPVSWPEFSKRLQEKKFTSAFFAWASSVPDADSALPIFHTRSLPPLGQNYGSYKNPRYDRLVEQIETSQNSSQRYSLIRQALKLLEQDLAVFPMAHRIGNQLYQPWVKNTSYADVLQIIPFLKYRRVETAPTK